MKHCIGVLLCLVFCLLSAARGEDVRKFGEFTVTLDKDNVYLPESIKWGETELLRPKVGLDHAFVSFEFRTKIYHDENKHVWGPRDDPRFFTDAKFKSIDEVKDGEYAGVRVNYDSSYAAVRRDLLFAPKPAGEDRAFRIRYRFTMTRDVVVHESGDFSVALQLAPIFTRRGVLDGRGEKAVSALSADGLKNAAHRASVLTYGPDWWQAPKAGVQMVILSSFGGDVQSPPPCRLLTFAKGKTLTLTLDCRVSRGDYATARFATAGRSIAAWQRPYLLVEDARLLAQTRQVEQAEHALLLAARLSKDYAAPFGSLAALRRDNKLPGQAEAWVEGGYRMPFNYGYMLSGSGLHHEKRMTEEQRRLHIFNLLITVENTVFYPDYYLWAARGFLEMKMYAQACAMYRQALWAVDYMPRSEKYRERMRVRFRKEIAKLEEQMVGHTLTELPPLTPLRAPEK